MKLNKLHFLNELAVRIPATHTNPNGQTETHAEGSEKEGQA